MDITEEEAMQSRKHLFVTFALAAAIGVLGCGPGGPRTYPVRGKVELVSGNATALAGSTIEAALESDTTVRASGTIQEDGRFTLETLHAGVILKGAQEGKYQARIILADDDPATRRRAAKALARRFLQFNTSGLSFEAPASGEVVLRVSPR
jgi:hypothetical protein